MNDTSKIILAIIAVIAVVTVYIYTQPAYVPYNPISSESSTPGFTPVPPGSPSPSAKPTPTAKPSATPAPKPSAAPTPTPTPVPPTPTPSPTLSPSPTLTPTPNPTPSPTPKIDTFNISAVEFSYSPNSITARSGDTIKINFTNNGAYSHNLTFQDLGAATQTIGPGQTSTIQFTAPAAGTYTFFCSVYSHKDLGLTGTLIVQ